MQVLNNRWALGARGILLIGTALLLFTISKNSTGNMVLLFSLLTLLAGLAGFKFTAPNKASPLKTNWLVLESSADVVFSLVAVYFYLRSTNLTTDFLTAFGCFAFAFTFFQVIYIFQVAQTGISPNIKMIAIRVLLGICYGVFGIVLLFNSSFPEASTALINFIGIGPLLAGIALLALSFKMYMVKKN